MRFKSARAGIVLVLLVTVAGLSGCSKSANLAGDERSDAQVAGDVQTRLSSDAALSGRQISINANKGVVTLSGTVNSDSEVTAALSDAQQAQGVKQVVSRLAVQQASLAPEPEPQPVQPSRRSYQAPSRASQSRSRHSLPSSSSSAYGNTQGTSTTTASSNTDFGSNAPASSPAYSAPAPPPPPRRVTVPAGTVMQVRTIEGLSSETSHPNDPWHGTLNSDIVVDDQTAIPAGAEVDGRVADVHSATHYTGAASLELSVDKLTFDGKTYQIATDTWRKEGDKRGKNTAEKVGGGAAVGAILGGIFGGGKGAAIGATAGAGAGAGANTITKGQRVELRPESLVTFRLENPVSVLPSTGTGRHGTVIRPDNSSPQ